MTRCPDGHRYPPLRRAITPDPEPGRDERRGRVRQGLAAKVFGTLGRVLIATGIVVLLFAAYQLWGTGLSEARAQGDLADEFARSLAAAPSAGPGGPAASSNTSADRKSTRLNSSH